MQTAANESRLLTYSRRCTCSQKWIQDYKVGCGYSSWCCRGWLHPLFPAPPHWGRQEVLQEKQLRKQGLQQWPEHMCGREYLGGAGREGECTCSLLLAAQLERTGSPLKCCPSSRQRGGEGERRGHAFECGGERNAYLLQDFSPWLWVLWWYGWGQR